ncbi:hypothetical protein [Kitasatospora sp. NPDC088783]|uniref:hypothetical protein n=1 Tax=Kitasatospora sp. NPDC088783 TaxID=3364077 RepID=UPI00382CBDDF
MAQVRGTPVLKGELIGDQPYLLGRGGPFALPPAGQRAGRIGHSRMVTMGNESVTDELLLHTGVRTAAPLAAVIGASLRFLADGGVNGRLALGDLVALAHDRTRTLPAVSLHRAWQAGLVEADGSIHRSVAEVVCAYAVGEGCNVVLVDPVTGR